MSDDSAERPFNASYGGFSRVDEQITKRVRYKIPVWITTDLIEIVPLKTARQVRTLLRAMESSIRYGPDSGTSELVFKTTRYSIPCRVVARDMAQPNGLQARHLIVSLDRDRHRIY